MGASTSKSTKIGLIIALLFLSCYSIIRSRNVSAAVVARSPISIGSNATVQVKNATLFTQTDGQYLMYTLTYTNNGSTTVQLTDYWSKVSKVSGGTYKTNIITKDSKIATLGPKSSVELTYYSPVDDNTTINQLQINIVKWDFSAPNYTRNLGTFKLANGYGTATAAFLPNYIQSKETKLKTAIKSVQSEIIGDYRKISISFLFENLNARQYSPSSNAFFLTGANGAVYSVNSETLKDVVILPKERKIVTLQVTVPASASDTGNKLLMGYSSEADQSLFIPLTAYQVPASKGSVTTVSATATYGDYLIELLGYSRLPSGAQDELTATFKVTNKSTDTAKVPAFKASWTVNGVSQVTTTPNAINFDQRLQLQPKESILIATKMSVPYTAALANINVTLKDVSSNQDGELVAQFNSPKVNNFTETSTQSVQFDRAGAKATVELLRVHSSEEGKQNVISGDLAITNLEARSNAMQNYQLYIIGANGTIYPLTSAAYDKSVIPNGRILVAFSGKVPLTAVSENMKVIVAEMMPYGTEGSGAQAPSILSSTGIITTKWPTIADQSKFNNLTVGNNDFSLDMFYAYLDFQGSGNPQGLNLDFTYNMLTDHGFDGLAGAYKLRFEIEDQNEDKTTFVKEIALDGTNQEFREGQNIKKTIQFSDPTIAEKIKSFTNFKLSIYSVSNDQKVLLAQKVFPYFTVNWSALNN